MRTPRGLLIAFLLSSVALADDADKVLKEAVKATLKIPSFRTSASIEGGLAVGAEHRIVTSKLNASYETETYKGLTHVTSPFDAYRLDGSTNGALFIEERWKSLNGFDSGRQMNKILKPMAQILTEINDLRKTAVWIDDGELPPVARGPTGSGTTTDPAPSDQPWTRHIRVEGPAKVAMSHFNDIQNSGCFNAG